MLWYHFIFRKIKKKIRLIINISYIGSKMLESFWGQGMGKGVAMSSWLDKSGSMGTGQV